MRILLTTLLALALGQATIVAQDVPPFRRGDRPGDPPPVPLSGEADPAQPGVETLGRGPVHEGFAQPGQSDPKPNPVVPKMPPDPVPEQPTENRPDGDNVMWMPGYWSWDEDRSDFLWVSGFWRVVPDGRKWVPGYWTKADSGARWVSGFWAPSAAAQVPYTEAPPESLERGPSMPAPGDDYDYVPGNWVWQDRWMWQPGFWNAHRPGLVYTPARWCWTPRGSIFVNSFWDYDLAGRGDLCAPVYFSDPGYFTAARPFRPGFFFNVGFGLGSFWARPGWGCYAFGDFYGPRYAGRGFQPWHTFGPRFRDPLFNYYRFANRGNPGWANRLDNTYRGRLAGTVAPPARIIGGRAAVAGAGGTRVTVNNTIVQSAATYRNPVLRQTRVSATERTAVVRQANTLRDVGRTRMTEEARTLPRGTRPAPLSLTTVPTTRSTGNPAARLTRPGGTDLPNRVQVARPTTPSPGLTRPAVTAPPFSPREGTRPATVTRPQVTTPPVTAPKNPVPRVITPGNPAGEPRILPREATPRATPVPTPRATPTPSPTPRANPAPVVRTPTVPRYNPPTPSVPRFTPPAQAAPRYSPPQTTAPRSMQSVRPAPSYTPGRMATSPGRAYGGQPGRR